MKAKLRKSFFGKRLRVIRDILGYSQQYLAQRIEREEDLISKYEIGQHKPSIETLERIIGTLEVPESAFTEEDVTIQLHYRSNELKNIVIISHHE